MVHVLAPRPPLPQLPLFFNVDGAVGANAPNSNPTDIMLVQFLIRLIGNTPDGALAAQSALLQRVNPTGTMDQNTIAAIKAVQAAEGKAVDGRVSSAQGYKYNGTYYTIVSLNFSVRGRATFKPTWPNLDRIAGCPGQLAAAVRNALAGTA